MKYQKRPVTVEAWKLDSEYRIAHTEEWVQQAYIEGIISFDVANGYWLIKTYGVTYFADDGFYIVKQEDGEIIRYSANTFEEKYMKVEGD